jgi:Rap1a immunity proteins
MRRLTAVVLALIALGPASTTSAEENRGSANYMLPLCKTWLKVAIEKDREAIKNILRTQPLGLTTAGMCAGTVIGIFEVLQMFGSICVPHGVTNEQLVRMVVNEIERRPEGMHQDFVVPTIAILVATWSCSK